MEDIKRALGGRNFWTAMLAASAVLAMGTKFVWSGELEADSHLKILMEAMKSDITVFMLPIIAVLPYTTAFVDEVSSGFGKFCLLRTNRFSYVAGKAAGAWTGAAAALAGGAFLNSFIYWLIFSPLEAAGGGGIWGEFAAQAIRLGMTGGLLALLGTCLAVWMMSNYMAYIAPFVIYYFLIMLKERYFEGIYCIYPKEWIAPEHYWGDGSIGLTLFFMAWTLFLGIVCVRMMYRRLEDV